MTVKSILLEPRLLRKVVRVLSSFIMCRCLLRRNTSRILPIALVWVSCHDLDLELLSIAKWTPARFAWCIIASILFKAPSICRFMSKYILAIIVLALSLKRLVPLCLHPTVVLVIYLIVGDHNGCSVSSLPRCIDFVLSWDNRNFVMYEKVLGYITHQSRLHRLFSLNCSWPPGNASN